MNSCYFEPGILKIDAKEQHIWAGILKKWHLLNMKWSEQEARSPASAA